jgi:hypothetical protein
MARDVGKVKYRLECGDCKMQNPRFFAVHDDLWCWHIPGPDLLCLSCAQVRLGRPFTLADFKPGIPVNEWVIAAFSV